MKIILLHIALFLMVLMSHAQTPQQKLPEKTRILFLLDGSGSMLAKWENTYRISVAKKLLSDFVDSLRTNQNLELALRIYGHQYDQRLRRCDDTRLEAPFAPNNHDRIINALKTLGPKGTTPIAYALEQAANDFPSNGHTRNIIIMITDGIESCDGDPCAVSLALQRKGVFLKPFIIGIGMDKEFENQFGCMGSFYDAADISAFRQALNNALYQSLGKTTVSVELLDAHDRPTETNVNVSFINHFTQNAAFEFVHYRDEVGRPDSVEIDPVLSYDIIVNTIPQVRQNNISIVAGKHNVLKVKAPQGMLSVLQPGHTEYKDGVLALVRPSGSSGLLTTIALPGKAPLLVGTYDVELTTLPRRIYKNVTIAQSKTSEVKPEQPGVVNFLTSSRGIGSIYQIMDDGSQRWIHNLDQTQIRNTVAIQPGSYKVVYRSEQAKGSKYTSIKSFEVKPGSSFNISL
ncbi:MAG: VWA domain-containing protein [Cyclobacteriaceae bacterium]|nr:VWA domain-containing protein [Cyclobacteriaceae bacterium]